MPDTNQHSELFNIVRGTIGMWRYKRDHEWDRRVDVALEALNDLEEQYESLKEQLDGTGKAAVREARRSADFLARAENAERKWAVERDRANGLLEQLERVVAGVTSKTALDVVAEKMAAEDRAKKAEAERDDLEEQYENLVALRDDLTLKAYERGQENERLKEQLEAMRVALDLFVNQPDLVGREDYIRARQVFFDSPDGRIVAYPAKEPDA